MTRALCVLAFVLAASPAFAQLRMAVRPGVSFAPANVEIRLQVEPGGRQREVLLVIDGDLFYRSSVFPIRTDPKAPTLQPVAVYRSIPPGDYQITATLTDCAPAGCARREQLRQVVFTLRVLGP